MNISLIGAGYVGLVTGACFSEMGNTVTCVDIDENKITRLKDGIIPIYEPGLEGMLTGSAKAGRLSFTTDTGEAVARSEVVFICVGTPPDSDGVADYTGL